MCDDIRLLEDSLIDKIAAGEVVSRPASVVKELVENSLDAGADRIDVEISNGGLGSIVVIDNGKGMTRSNAQLCTSRHATSKLSRFEELAELQSFGFRGEALAAIVSVSRWAIQTRRTDDPVGTRISSEGSRPAAVADIGCAPGTRIEIAELFFNVPARLQFLKSTTTENSHIAEVVMNAALANPQVHFRLVRDGRLIRDYQRHNDHLSRASSILRESTMLPFRVKHEEVSIEAALAPPERARSNSSGLRILVNRRPVKDRGLAHALAFAYGSVMPPGRYPFGALFIEVPAAEIDVNVHPQKTEIRFAKPRRILDIVSRSLSKELAKSNWLNIARHSNEGAANASQRPPGFYPAMAQHLSEGILSLNQKQTSYGSPNLDSQSQSLGFFAQLRFIAQLKNMYILCEGQDALYILDQHAADERIRFAKLHKAFTEGSVTKQRLLFPERVTLDPKRMAYALEHHEALESLGIESRAIADDALLIDEVPAQLAHLSVELLINDALSEITHTAQRSFSDRMDTVLATMACHASRSAGDAMSAHECKALLSALDEVSDFQGHCHHDQPIAHTLAFSDIVIHS
ncbi:MAG: DNA mismatch repair endonuclease MutL [Myxococcales bacterium]|nr:MAG: DNA mismatch repair endonuclease MutL [Myxococcales bacterium]